MRTEHLARRDYIDLRRSYVVGAFALGAVAFVLEWYRFATHRSLTMDLAVFDQAIWKLAHGHGPEVTVIGWNVFAEHLSPVLFLLADDTNLHTLRFHDQAPVFPFLLLAAATGISRLTAERARVTGRVLVPTFTVLVLLALGPLDTKSLTDETVAAGDARRALSSVDPTDRVVADDQLAPHLSERSFLLPYPYPFARAHQQFPVAASVARVSPEVAATIDTVVIGSTPTPDLPGFTPHRYGTVVVYRRTSDAR